MDCSRHQAPTPRPIASSSKAVQAVKLDGVRARLKTNNEAMKSGPNAVAQRNHQTASENLLEKDSKYCNTTKMPIPSSRWE